MARKPTNVVQQIRQAQCHHHQRYLPPAVWII
jgi:hypothetical protein